MELVGSDSHEVFATDVDMDVGNEGMQEYTGSILEDSTFRC